MNRIAIDAFRQDGFLLDSGDFSVSLTRCDDQGIQAVCCMFASALNLLGIISQSDHHLNLASLLGLMPPRPIPSDGLGLAPGACPGLNLWIVPIFLDLPTPEKPQNIG